MRKNDLATFRWHICPVRLPDLFDAVRQDSTSCYLLDAFEKIVLFDHADLLESDNEILQCRFFCFDRAGVYPQVLPIIDGEVRVAPGRPDAEEEDEDMELPEWWPIDAPDPALAWDRSCSAYGGFTWIEYLYLCRVSIFLADLEAMLLKGTATCLGLVEPKSPSLEEMKIDRRWFMQRIAFDFDRSIIYVDSLELPPRWVPIFSEVRLTSKWLEKAGSHKIELRDVVSSAVERALRAGCKSHNELRKMVLAFMQEGGIEIIQASEGKILLHRETKSRFAYASFDRELRYCKNQVNFGHGLQQLMSSRSRPRK